MRQLVYVVQPTDQRLKPTFERLLAVAAPKVQILPIVAAKHRDLEFIMTGTNQGLLYLLLRKINKGVAVQFALDFEEIVSWDCALEYFDVVAVVGFEMECAGGLQQSAGVFFESGMLESQEIRI
jgi:hypothetical protein